MLGEETQLERAQSGTMGKSGSLSKAVGLGELWFLTIKIMQEAEHGDRRLQSKTSGDRRVEGQLELPRKTLRPEKMLRRKNEEGKLFKLL